MPLISIEIHNSKLRKHYFKPKIKIFLNLRGTEFALFNSEDFLFQIKNKRIFILNFPATAPSKTLGIFSLPIRWIRASDKRVMAAAAGTPSGHTKSGEEERMVGGNDQLSASTPTHFKGIASHVWLYMYRVAH